MAHHFQNLRTSRYRFGILDHFIQDTYIGVPQFPRECLPKLDIFRDNHWISKEGGLIPVNFSRKLPHSNVPTYKLAGFYGSDYMTPIFSDTYGNAILSAQIACDAALSAVQMFTTEPNLISVSYALCCSPGHHASVNTYNGYCFINNAVVVAKKFIDLGKKKVGILDVDYHAGNGTNEIVTNIFPDDMVSCSIHIDPVLDYPSFDSYETENCHCVHNYILPAGTTWNQYSMKLMSACKFLQSHEIDALVIAFGADTYKNDPDSTA